MYSAICLAASLTALLANGAQAACARGIQQWCDNPTKRSFEPVNLRRSVDVGAVNGDEGEGHIASVQADHDGSDGVHVGAANDGVDVGLGNKITRRGLEVGALNADGMSPPSPSGSNVC